jgi:hypothetical protein
VVDESGDEGHYSLRTRNAFISPQGFQGQGGKIRILNCTLGSVP